MAKAKTNPLITTRELCIDGVVIPEGKVVADVACELPGDRPLIKLANAIKNGYVIQKKPKKTADEPATPDV